MKDYKVIIIGGGLIGLSTAYNLVKEYNGHPVIDGKDILVLEKMNFLMIREVALEIPVSLDINTQKNICQI